MTYALFILSEITVQKLQYKVQIYIERKYKQKKNNIRVKTMSKVQIQKYTMPKKLTGKRITCLRSGI